MSKPTNFAFSATGKIFGFDSKITILSANGKKLIHGSLDTHGKKMKELLENKELEATELVEQFTFVDKLKGHFYAEVLISSGLTSFVIKYAHQVSGKEQALFCNMVSLDTVKQLALSMDVAVFSDGNTFEQFIYDTMTFFSIQKVAVIVRNKASTSINQYLKSESSDYFPGVILSDSYAKYSLIANSLFDLKNSESAFGKGLYSLTGLDHIDLIIGTTLNASSFEAMLISKNIQKQDYLINELFFGIRRENGFLLEAGGKLSFPLKKEVLEFVIAGSLSLSSFTLSASSTYKIPINSKISLGDLGLMVGVGSTGVTFGMTGRVTTNTLTIFGGFIVSQANIGLITAALTSTKGRMSLKDIIVDIAEVEFPGIELLDVVALADFDMNGVKIPDWQNKSDKIEIFKEFNSTMPNELAIPDVENLQISALGTSQQSVLTDTSTMRHYRIDSVGMISLNCQLFICSQPTKIGAYHMQVGFFMCGTIEIFNVRARGLFLIEPGNSIVTLIEVSKIDLKGIFELTRSKKELPMQPLEGGLAGALVKPDSQGPVLYLNINRATQKIEFYLSAYVNILNIFQLDALILLKDRRVYIHLELQYVGFKILFNLEGAYDHFSDSGFKARLAFDTNGFSQILEEAQQAVKDAARSVQSSIENATKKLNEAQQQILNLNNTINEYDHHIRAFISKRADASWWRVDDKIYYSAQIVYYETLKVGVNVAIGVAYGVLEVAKAALKLGGHVVSGALEAVANILNAITKLLWIKSFELGMEFNSNVKKINAKLELTVFGNDIVFNGSIDVDKAIHNIASLITDFVKDTLSAKTKELTSNIHNGIFRNLTSEEDYEGLGPKFRNIEQTKQDYYELLEFQLKMEDFFSESTKIYLNEYGKEPQNWQENICEIEEVKLRNEVIQAQCVEAFDNEFITSLDEVILLVQDNQVRSAVSDEINQQMNNLSALVKAINRQKMTSKAFRERQSLFSRVENTMENSNEVKRSLKFSEEFSMEQANKNYADGLSHLLKNSFSETTTQFGEAFKTSAAAAIYQFRNPPKVNPRR